MKSRNELVKYKTNLIYNYAYNRLQRLPLVLMMAIKTNSEVLNARMSFLSFGYFFATKSWWMKIIHYLC